MDLTYLTLGPQSSSELIRSSNRYRFMNRRPTSLNTPIDDNSNTDDFQSDVANFYTDPYRAERTKKVRDVTKECFITLSTCKPGFGLQNLIDGDRNTYWQSDGPQPHTITIEFQKKMDIVAIYLYVDYRQDESYTPGLVYLREGTRHDQLTRIDSFQFNHPIGWICIPLTKDGYEEFIQRGSTQHSKKVWTLQIAILSNHSSGRDTHIRQLKIHAKASSDWPNYQSTAFFQHAMIR
ncbi:hypothetical protein GJ496_010554 [Pomphorhynchus laevis]|nr:hypothetical protein GJ496_010554 [Pomphorhynchus laevis]